MRASTSSRRRIRSARSPHHKRRRRGVQRRQIMNCGIKHSRGWKQLQPFAAALLLAAFGNTAFAGEAKPPIILDSTGGFEVGGKVITKPGDPNQTLSCD